MKDKSRLKGRVENAGFGSHRIESTSFSLGFVLSFSCGLS